MLCSPLLFNLLFSDHFCFTLSGKLLSREPRVDWRFLTDGSLDDASPSTMARRGRGSRGNAGVDGISGTSNHPGDDDVSQPAATGSTPRTFRLTAARAFTVPFHARVSTSFIHANLADFELNLFTLWSSVL